MKLLLPFVGHISLMDHLEILLQEGVKNPRSFLKLEKGHFRLLCFFFPFRSFSKGLDSR